MRTTKLQDLEVPDGLDIFELQAWFCGLFSNPARLRIMALLAEGERCVGDIARELDMSLSTVSQHLQTMKDRRAVRQRREGQNVFYQVTNDKFLQASVLICRGLLEEHHHGVPRAREDASRSKPRRAKRESEDKENEPWTQRILPT